MRGGPGDWEVLYLPTEEKIPLPLLRTVRRHHIHEGAADALPERGSDLTVRQGIAKRHNVLHINLLTYGLSHRELGVSIRQLAALQEFAETYNHQRTIAERRQRGGHVLSVEGTEACRQAHRSLRGGRAVAQGELSR